MADTANYEWEKPTVGGDRGAWGTKLNETLDDIDADLKTVDDKCAAIVGKVLNISHLFFRPSFPGNMDFDAGNGYTQVDSAGIGQSIRAAILLPSGVTITGLKLFMDPGAAVTHSFQLYRTAKVDGAASSLVTVGPTSGTAYQSISNMALDVDVEEEYFYEVLVTCSGAWPDSRVYGLEVTYDSPGPAVTV